MIEGDRVIYADGTPRIGVIRKIIGAQACVVWDDAPHAQPWYGFDALQEVAVTHDRPLAEWSISERIAAWRTSGRYYTRRAESALDGGDDRAAIFAAAAVMYFTLAHDAQVFGELPELPEDRESGDEPAPTSIPTLE